MQFLWTHQVVFLGILFSLSAFASDNTIKKPESETAIISGQKVNVPELLSSQQCQEFLEFAEGAGDETAKKLNAKTFALTIQDKHGNKIIDRRYLDLQDGQLFKMWSISKTVTTLAIGRLEYLLKEKKIEKPKYLTRPDFLTRSSRLSSHLIREDLKSLVKKGMKEPPTVEHLLSMAAGIPWCEYQSCSSRDMVKLSYTAKGRDDNSLAYLSNLDPMNKVTPGLRYEYSAGNATLVQLILKNYLGENYDRFFEEEVFGKLGIKKYAWEKDGQGVRMGGSGLFLTAEALAKVSQLFLTKGKIGKIDGEVFVPTKFINWMTSINKYLKKEATGTKAKQWETAAGKGLWMNYRDSDKEIAQFMPQVAENVVYMNSWTGNRFAVFKTEHNSCESEKKDCEKDKFGPEGLGINISRLGADKKISAYWKPFLNKLYSCLNTQVEDPAQRLREPEEGRFPPRCIAPDQTSLDQKKSAGRELLYQLAPFTSRAVELCNCLFVAKVAENEKFNGSKEEMINRCDEFFPNDKPDVVPDDFWPKAEDTSVEGKTVKIVARPIPLNLWQAVLYQVGSSYKKDVFNIAATFDENLKSCRLSRAPNTWGENLLVSLLAGRTNVNPSIEKEDAYTKAKELIDPTGCTSFDDMTEKQIDRVNDWLMNKSWDETATKLKYPIIIYNPKKKNN